ncbi:Putative DNA-binding domain-containing protein [Hymenobacter daecheongensis DSM 21074]|uniref:Putative DNA-binding domain-containing protein n=1 Tax=Hymenobacter daecheongensis DSM 21074 TaxID=1121955 RepID=A0A1M6HTA3_9BACT|nr:ATP-binding protein [Hymenobacter daecheongensis]SHJ25439.1 Putative DNA-binding domain-containing protein [Hymenobacter daecheongensis DSM 21074]
MSELQNLIKQGEGEQVEFKKKTTHPTRISRTLASLANTRGGHVLVGIDDAGRVVGVRDAEEEMYLLQMAAAQYVEPPLNLHFEEVEEDGRTVIIVTVAESSHKPHRAQVAEGDWRGYVRVRDESVQTSGLTEKALERADAPSQLEHIPLNRHEMAVLEYLRKHPRITLAQYMKLGNLGRRRAYQTLIKLTLHGYLRHHDKEKEVYYTL